MGPTDRVENPTPITTGTDLSDSFTIHMPKLQPPTLEELLEDRLEHTSGSSGGFGALTPSTAPMFLGPVDIAVLSDEVRRFFEN